MKVEKSSFNYNYPFQVWIGSIVIGSFLLIVLTLFKDGNNTDILYGISWLGFYLLLFGFLFSSPVFFISWVLFMSISNMKISTLNLKIISFFIAITGMIITMYFFEERDIQRLYYDLEMLLSYSIGIIFCCFYFKAKKPVSKMTSIIEE
ncbi:MAG: hypothetical protein NTX03_14840 [Bacteroidetes bacterium]|nr:hypothetical protein [Bacteroidota bacterium]